MATQALKAKFIGISQPHYYRITNGKSPICVRLSKKLQKRLGGVFTDYLTMKPYEIDQSVEKALSEKVITS